MSSLGSPIFSRAACRERFLTLGLEAMSREGRKLGAGVSRPEDITLGAPGLLAGNPEGREQRKRHFKNEYNHYVTQVVKCQINWTYLKPMDYQVCR